MIFKTFPTFILDSRSGTPQNTSRKSPVNDSSAQANQSQRENQSGGGNKEKPHQTQRNNNQRNNNQQQREHRDSGRNELQENKGGYRVRQYLYLCYG